jgi:RNA polymerase sigma-70 factor, ECF subfamily
MSPFLPRIRRSNVDRIHGGAPGVACHGVAGSGSQRGGMTPAGQELIAGMARGDADAFAQFYDRYAPLAYSLILRIVRDRTDGSEVLQDVFWEAWEAAAAYDPERGTPEAWVAMRARARAIDRIRSLRRRHEVFVAPVDEAVMAETESPSDPAESAESRGVVQSALAQLSDIQREVIELAYYGGLTQSEIAQRTNQPLGTVKTRIRMGLDRLREVVKRP